jgi:hypothetical protein
MYIEVRDAKTLADLTKTALDNNNLKLAKMETAMYNLSVKNNQALCRIILYASELDRLHNNYNFTKKA